MGVKIQINRKKSYLSITVNEIRWRECTGLTVSPDKKQNMKVLRMAEVIRSNKEISLAAYRYGVVDPEGSRMPLVEYLHREVKDKPKKHSLRYVLKFVEMFAGNLKLESLSPQWIEEFQNFLTSRTELTSNSAEVYMQAFRSAIKKAVRNNLIIKDPCLGVKHIKGEEKRKEYLTTSDIKLLKDCTPKDLFKQEIKNAFLFSVYTGLRVSDLRTLKLEDINFSTKIIQKQQIKTSNFVYIPLSEQAMEILKGQEKIRQKMDNEKTIYVFPYLCSTRCHCNQYLIDWGKDAGVKIHMGWHLARHTFATLILESGADIYTVQKLLGHRELKTTTRYAKVTDKKIREAIDAFPLIS